MTIWPIMASENRVSATGLIIPDESVACNGVAIMRCERLAGMLNY
jgi:hypothetical protein